MLVQGPSTSTRVDRVGRVTGASESGVKLVVEDLPVVTILMPVRNGARFIEPSLRSVLAQDYPADRLEILILDGLSEDGTPEIIGRTWHRWTSEAKPGADGSTSPSARVRLLRNPSRTVPSALNIGLQHATGSVIFRLDGHSEMASNYVRECVAKLQTHPESACVGGPSVAVGAGWVGSAYALALRSALGAGGKTFRTLHAARYVDTLAFGGYRREVFEQVGCFDQDLWRNQDIEFNARLRKAGRRLLLIPQTRTFYHAPESATAILRQNYNNGYWNTRVLDRMVGVLSWRHYVPCLFVVSWVVCALMAFFLPSGKNFFTLLGASYVVACLLGSVRAATQHWRASALLLPVLFPMIHISYGVGSLIGLFQFVIHAGVRRFTAK
jgi:glycosyltransferase involved in cell wall biosynthesis